MRKYLTAVVLMMLVVTACGDDSAATTTTAATITTATTTTAATATSAATTTTIADTPTTRPISEAIVGFWVRYSPAEGTQGIYFGADGEFFYIVGPDPSRSACPGTDRCDSGTYTLDGDTLNLMTAECAPGQEALMTVNVFPTSVPALSITVINDTCGGGGDPTTNILAEEPNWTYQSAAPAP